MTSMTKTRRPPLMVPEAALYMNVSERFVRRLIEERRITFMKVGRFIRFDPDVLDEFLDDGIVEAVR